MKKGFLLAGVTALLCLFAPKAIAQDYTLRVLTFEDSDLGASFTAEKTGEGAFSAATWSDLIDDPQYGGFLYTGSSLSWYDGGNTELYHTFGLPYWGGGHTVSNYACNDLTTYGNYDMQLTVYKADEDVLVQTGGGHGGSDNFAVHFGYISGYTPNAPEITFADGVERVIDHMYVNNTTYVLNQYLTGGGFNPAALTTSWFRIKATGYNASNVATNTIYFYLCQGNELGNGVIDEWTEWDMTGLGAVASVTFDMEASDDMVGEWGMNVPAYFAYDDVAVRFPAAAPTTYERSVTNGNYGTICLPYAVNEGDYSGATFYRAVGQTTEGIVIEEVGNLEAGKAYIFRATATTISCTYTGDAVATPVSASSNNGLQGTFEDNTVVPTGKWLLHNNLLYQSTGTQKVNANRAYIDVTYVPAGVPSPAPGRRQVVIANAPEQTTGIEDNVMTEPVQKTMINGVVYVIRNGKMYDLRGQEVK
ncbi:MAG: DUF4465 domain-containing protein [Paludibacteraceae bacterium]|nr:DUF4465 domain-containing protein [Paludibacteraceae bacterium]